LLLTFRIPLDGLDGRRTLPRGGPPFGSGTWLTIRNMSAPSQNIDSANVIPSERQRWLAARSRPQQNLIETVFGITI